MTTDPDPAESPGRAMARALAQYTMWLCDSLSGQTSSKASGSELLAQIGSIQRRDFSDAGHVMAGLLRGHSDIATLMYEHRMAGIRLGVSRKLESAEAVVLAEVQFTFLQALRTYCGDAEPHAVHGGSERAGAVQ